MSWKPVKHFYNYNNKPPPELVSYYQRYIPYHITRFKSPRFECIHSCGWIGCGKAHKTLSAAKKHCKTLEETDARYE